MDKMIKNEALRIAQKYSDKPKTLTPIEEIRLLDRKATQKAQVVSLCIGIIGTLTLGVGMCCIMVWNGLFALGVILGVLGIGIALGAYPVYKKLFEKKKRELAPRIISLSKMVTEEVNI